MITTVEGRVLRGVTKAEAERIRDLQKTEHRWGYIPDVFPFRGQWAVTLYGERDYAAAKALVEGWRG